MRNSIRYIFVLWLLNFVVKAQKEVSFAHQNISLLPYSLQNNKELESLDLSYSTIEKLPEWLSKFPNLKSVNLNHTRLKNPLNDAQILSDCKELVEVQWNYGHLAYFPIPLAYSKRLQTLQLEGNAISFLPKNIQWLPLKNLNIANNLVDTLPNEIIKMKQLHEINLSFNPALNNPYNYKILAKVKALENLILQGIKQVPKELGEVKQLKKLDFSFSSFTNLPTEVKNLPQIESVKIYQTQTIEVHEFIEQISTWKKTKTLIIGSPNFNRLPFNINKLPNLKTLIIQNSCLNQSPAIIQKLPLQNIKFIQCNFINLNDVLGPFLQNNNIKNIGLQQCTIQNFSSDLDLGNKDSVLFTDNKMFDFPFTKGRIQYLNIKGNYITQKSLQNLSILKIEGAVEGNNLSYTKEFVSAKKIQSDSSHTAFKVTVYANIGGIFPLPNGAQLHVPNDAFLDINHQTLKGDVVMHFTYLQNATDILLNDIPLWDKNLHALHFLQWFKLELYTNGKPAFVSTKNPLKIVYQSGVENPLLLQYNSYKSQWETNDKIIKECDLKNEVITSNPFKIFMLNQNKNFGDDNQVNLYRGNVQIKVKHNKQKESMNFDLLADADYGLNLAGFNNNFTLAYPELKTYQNIRWNYMGRNLNEDLIKLLNLSLSPETDKIARKNTFLVKTNQLSNVLLYPNPDEDNYIFEFASATDTVKIPVLPYIAIIKPKKIQRWHRKRYEEYENKLSKRQQQWAQLDSAFVKALLKNQKKLQQIAQNYTPDNAENTNLKKSIITHSTFITQTGWNILAKPLTENDWVKIEPTFYINNKQNFSKDCLVYHPEKKYFYWSNTKEIWMPKDTEMQVFVKVGKQFVYSSTLQSNSLKINLNKVD